MRLTFTLFSSSVCQAADIRVTSALGETEVRHSNCQSQVSSSIGSNYQDIIARRFGIEEVQIGLKIGGSFKRLTALFPAS